MNFLKNYTKVVLINGKEGLTGKTPQGIQLSAIFLFLS